MRIERWWLHEATVLTTDLPKIPICRDNQSTVSVNGVTRCTEFS